MRLKNACSLQSYDKPRQHIESRDIALPTKVHIVKAIVFPIVMYGCESWKAEHWRTDAFQLCCQRTLCFNRKYLIESNLSTHSSTLAWKIPWTEEPGGLQSMGSRRVGHDWATSLSLFTFMHWRRKWQPTPVFLPGESQGLGAWWAAIYGVVQSQTRLKQLSSSSSNNLFFNFLWWNISNMHKVDGVV